MLRVRAILVLLAFMIVMNAAAKSGCENAARARYTENSNSSVGAPYTGENLSTISMSR